jgi:hypothetical protein
MTTYRNEKTAIYPKSKGVANPGERSDCVIRAAVNAGVADYQKVHDVCKYFGRENRKPTHLGTWIRAYTHLGVKLIGVFGTSLTAQNEAYELNKRGCVFETFKGITIKSFVKNFSKGTFICMSNNHAFAIVDGELIDKTSLLHNTRITVVFEVKK